MSDYVVRPTDPASASFGFALGVAAFAIGGLMLLHPVANATSLVEFKSGISQIAAQLAIVHGTVIVSEWLAVVGLLGLCDALGFKRLAVRAGLVAFVVGIALISINALINGFVIPGLMVPGVRGQPSSPHELRPLFALWKQSNSILSQACVAACSVAVLFWSFAMIHSRAETKVVAVIGVFCGSLPIAAISMSPFPMDGHEFAFFVFSQCVWYLVVAVQLVRARI